MSSSFLDKTDLPSSKLELQGITSDPPKNRKLHMELAIIVDAKEPFLKATYNLEGDGSLIFKAHKEIALLSAGILKVFQTRNIVEDFRIMDKIMLFP